MVIKNPKNAIYDYIVMLYAIFHDRCHDDAMSQAVTGSVTGTKKITVT